MRWKTSLQVLRRLLQCVDKPVLWVVVKGLGFRDLDFSLRVISLQVFSIALDPHLYVLTFTRSHVHTFTRSHVVVFTRSHVHMFTRTRFYTTACRHLITFGFFSQSYFIAGFFNSIRRFAPSWQGGSVTARGRSQHAIGVGCGKDGEVGGAEVTTRWEKRGKRLKSIFSLSYSALPELVGHGACKAACVA